MAAHRALREMRVHGVTKSYGIAKGEHGSGWDHSTYASVTMTVTRSDILSAITFS